MQILTTIAEIEAFRNACKKNQQSICLVPTMGYYHEGHKALMRLGRTCADKLVVSLFVNPTQFGPTEDLASYPRDPKRDSEIAESLGCDVLFMPEPSEMYSPNHATWVEVPEMSKTLCGISRPIHFRGVCTVVLKLFHLTGCDIAIFGEKDWQQQAILKQMVKDLNVPVEIRTNPTVREEDGLALSSRNVYLTQEERAQAPSLYAGLTYVRSLVEQGETHIQILRDALLERWSKQIPLARLDYLTFVHPETLQTLDKIDGPALLACAIRLGKARLIDNIRLN